MRLVAELTRICEQEQSPFRAQLLREDIARLTRLQVLAAEHDTLEAFVEAGLYIGWTRDDMRTHELKEPLQALLRDIYRSRRSQGDPAAEEAVVQSWIRFNRARMSRLIHCL